MEDKILAVNPQEPAEIIPVEEGIELVIARAEKQVKILDKVLGIALQRTNHYDWTDMQGKPYLTSSGAEKLMALFGINITDTSSDKKYSKDEKGDYYLYQYKGTFFWKAGSIEVVGACSSRDKFFAWDSKSQNFKPLAEVDEVNIMKAAYSNMIVNGVTRLLGIRNLTWEQVEAYKAGVSRDTVAKVSYRDTNKTVTDEEKKKQDEIAKMLLEMCYNDQDAASKQLVELTKFSGRDGKEVSGVDNPRKLAGKRLEIAYDKIKKGYDQFKQGGEQ